MEWHKQIQMLSFDITSHCNASCGGCIRNIYGGEKRPWLNLDHFNLEVFRRVFFEDLKVFNIKAIGYNGNWGDAAMHPYLIDQINIIKETHPHVRLKIATNGGVRSTDWWYELGASIKSMDHNIDFAIDGLEDTHHLYRRKTDYNKVVANARAFIDGGGMATWMMTAFEYNDGEYAEAEDRARRFGFDQFRLRKSQGSNFLIQTDTENYHVKENKDVSPYFVKFGTGTQEKDPLGNDNSTKCPWYNGKKLQVDPWGNVWPCCHLSNYSSAPVLFPKIADAKEFDFSSERQKHNLQNNLHHNSLGEILSSDWYNKRLPNMIDNDPWYSCKTNCGV